MELKKIILLHNHFVSLYKKCYENYFFCLQIQVTHVYRRFATVRPYVASSGMMVFDSASIPVFHRISLHMFCFFFIFRMVGQRKRRRNKRKARRSGILISSKNYATRSKRLGSTVRNSSRQKMGVA